jgi:chemotaxis protein methyltransferase CheR
VNEVLPTGIVSLPRPIRIWSAACATGEEPLTLAIALAEGGWFDRADIEILASDASQAAITKAQRGIYAGRSFRSLPDSLKEKYFSPAEKGWRVAPELHSKITWSVANILNASEINALVPASIIFCRNVFIYFSKEAIERTVNLFASRMRRPGYLFVGASESLLAVTDDFDLEEIDGCFVYTLAQIGEGNSF